MPFVTLALALSLGTAGMPGPAKIGATCMKSPVDIATDNEPDDNTIEHSVVNIWAFRSGESGTVIGWLYKNKVGAYFVQLSEAAAELAHVGALRDYVRNTSGGGNDLPKQTSPAELVDLENILAAKGIQRFACFAGDYKM